jgi:hypothetical protein
MIHAPSRLFEHDILCNVSVVPASQTQNEQSSRSRELDDCSTAASVYKNITPRGLLGLVFTIEQRNTNSTNISVAGQGQRMMIATRFTPPNHVELSETMSSVALYMAKSTNNQLLD